VLSSGTMSMSRDGGRLVPARARWAPGLSSSGQAGTLGHHTGAWNVRREMGKPADVAIGAHRPVRWVQAELVVQLTRATCAEPSIGSDLWGALPCPVITTFLIPFRKKDTGG
jgi:hypothetical protein